MRGCVQGSVTGDPAEKGSFKASMTFFFFFFEKKDKVIQSCRQQEQAVQRPKDEEECRMLEGLG